ncbi:hypothetical protein Adt_39736 [Abeliophyllum distichum]|uniref:Uncharacterized protein n=1 Tax=Abeliophyllum distichum TaxID=126358 RepID=A0ABD1Q5Y3_9LAMI
MGRGVGVVLVQRSDGGGGSGGGGASGGQRQLKIHGTHRPRKGTTDSLGLLGQFTRVRSTVSGSNSLHSHWARRQMEANSLSPTPANLPHSLPPPNRLPTGSEKRVNLLKLGCFTGLSNQSSSNSTSVSIRVIKRSV